MIIQFLIVLFLDFLASLGQSFDLVRQIEDSGGLIEYLSFCLIETFFLLFLNNLVLNLVVHSFVGITSVLLRSKTCSLLF